MNIVQRPCIVVEWIHGVLVVVLYSIFFRWTCKVKSAQLFVDTLHIPNLKFYKFGLVN
jgi:hypothetical protein